MKNGRKAKKNLQLKRKSGLQMVFLSYNFLQKPAYKWTYEYKKVDIEELKLDIENKKVDIENVLSQKGSGLSVKTTIHIHRRSLLNWYQVTEKENIKEE